MTKISMKRFNKVVELKLPTEHEHVMLSLWRLGLTAGSGEVHPA